MQKRRLRIRVSYEANRLAEAHLTSAYERLVPIIRYPIEVASQEQANEKAELIQPLKGVSSC